MTPTNYIEWNGYHVRKLGCKKNPIWYFERFGIVTSSNSILCEQIDCVSHDLIASHSELATSILFKDANSRKPKTSIEKKEETVSYTWTAEERAAILKKSKKTSGVPYDPMNHLSFTMPTIKDKYGNVISSLLLQQSETKEMSEEEAAAELARRQAEEEIARDIHALRYGNPSEKKEAQDRIRQRNRKAEADRIRRENEARADADRRMKAEREKIRRQIAEAERAAEARKAAEAEAARRREARRLEEFEKKTKARKLDSDHTIKTMIKSLLFRSADSLHNLNYFKAHFDDEMEFYEAPGGNISFMMASISAHEPNSFAQKVNIKAELANFYGAGPESYDGLSCEDECIVEFGMDGMDLVFNLAPRHTETFLRYLYKELTFKEPTIYNRDYHNLRYNVGAIFWDEYEGTDYYTNYRWHPLDNPNFTVEVTGTREYANRVTYRVTFREGGELVDAGCRKLIEYFNAKFASRRAYFV